MDAIRHQAVSQEMQGQAGSGVGHCFDEGVVVGGLMEPGLAAIAAIEDVIPQPAMEARAVLGMTLY